MPSPFPGMDPYLEDPSIWPGFHQAMITHLGEALNDVLPSMYVANLNERLSIVSTDRIIYPDITIRGHLEDEPETSTVNGISTAPSVGDDPVLLMLDPEEVREPFIEILALGDSERVVTVIELLSPANKTAGSAGRREYRKKQREVLASRVHFLEIDFLKRGRHTVLAPVEKYSAGISFDLLISLSRADRRRICETWPLTYRQRLASVRVPLENGSSDVPLDLQAAFDRSYHGQGYGRRINYRKPPPIPLPRETREWIDVLLREKGLRG